MTDSRARLLSLLRTHSYREGDFLLASGRRSTFYIDVRKTSLSAEGAVLIGECFCDTIAAQGWDVAGVGGLTLGADPLATATSIASWRRGRPIGAFLVRKSAKAHGSQQRIEAGGDLPDGAAVLIVDDTITTGGSTIDAIGAARDAGYRVVAAMCVVDRGEGGAEAIAAAGVPLVSLFDIAALRAG